MNKTIKKIIALGMGATMLVGTGAMALATDLSNYPAPFVKDGVFVGKIVIGATAQSIDTVGALDIAASLQRAASTTVSSSGSSTTVEGGYSLDTSSDRIYYGDVFSVDSVTKTNLNLLSDSSFEDSEGNGYDYTQSIVFKKSQTKTLGLHTESSVDSFLAFDLSTSVSTSSYLYADKVDFNKAVNATKDTIIGQKITLFGSEYTFSSESVAGTGGKVVLYGSSEEVSITTKDEVTKNVDGKDYTVKVIGFSSSGSKATISVNGVTDSVSEGSSKTIGGLKIYAKSVSSWNNGIDGFATLQLGANKVVLEDGQAVAVGSAEDSIDGTFVDLVGNADSLSAIYIYVNAKDSSGEGSYLKAGSAYVDPVFGTFKVSYEGENYALTDAAKDLVTVQPTGASRIYAKITPTGGTEKTVYFDYQGALAYDSNRAIISMENASVAENQYTYLTQNSADYTHLVKVKQIKVHATSGYAEFEDVLSGATYKSVEGAFASGNASLDMTVDGKTYKVMLQDNSSAAPKVGVAYGAADTIYPTIKLKSGEVVAFVAPVTVSILNTTVINTPTGTITIPAAAGAAVTAVYGSDDTGSQFAWNVTTSAANIATAIAPASSGYPMVLIAEPKDTNSRVNFVYVTTTNDSTGVNAGTYGFKGSGANATGASMADSDTTAGIDYYGTYVTRYNPSGDNDVVVKLYIPSDQAYANVFISPLAAKASSTSSSGAVSLNPISVGMAILDSEASLGSKPYIVVGGPCVNTLAATLMGNPADCAAGFTEGKAMIKLFADQNALLVAGYTGKDTQGACRVLAAYKDYGFSGTELEVVTANLNSLSVKKISN